MNMDGTEVTWSMTYWDKWNQNNTQEPNKEGIYAACQLLTSAHTCKRRCVFQTPGGRPGRMIGA